MKNLSKTNILNKVFNREDNTLKVENIDGPDSDNDSIATVNKPIEHVFHNNVGTPDPAAGNVFECIGERKKLVLTIKRNSITANQIDFLKSNDNVVFTPLLGIKVVADSSTPPQPSSVLRINSVGTDDVMYEFDIEAIKYIKMNKTSLTGTSIHISGVIV